MVFAKCQHLPEATPVVIERFGFPIWRGMEDHGVEEGNTTDPDGIAKCSGIKPFLWLLWTIEPCREAGRCQRNGLELH